MFVRLSLITLLVCGGCTPPGPAPPLAGDTADPGPDTTDEVSRLSPQAWLARASIDLRGRRASLDELAQAADEDAARTLVDSFVDDAALGERLAWLYDDHLRTAQYFMNTEVRIWDPLGDEAMQAAGWAPLQLVRHAIDQDLPLGTLVTATELPRNDALAAAFDLDAPGTGTAWALMPPPDDRPMAGLLSSSELWFVYDADAFNWNRRRANAVARIFLCDDLLLRDVTFALDLTVTELESLEDTVRTAANCTTCHATLDPLAAFFGGFPDRSVAVDPGPLYRYSEWSATWATGRTEPAWFGRPAADLAELGALVAADPRFPRCTTKVLTEGLMGRSLVDALGDEAAVETWLDGVMAELGEPRDLTGRDVARTVVMHPAYREGDERVLRPESLASVLGALLGLDPEGELLRDLTWSTEQRLLGGGIDDSTITERNPVPGVGHLVLQGWAARAVAEVALDTDAARATGSRLMWTQAEPWTVDATERRLQLAEWHGVFLSEPVTADAPEVERLDALWAAAGGPDAPETAWATVVEALIRHPRSLLY